jgi:hypothetical protein
MDVGQIRESYILVPERRGPSDLTISIPDFGQCATIPMLLSEHFPQ